MRELYIEDRLIDDDSPCYVIAEVGHNHQGSMEKAMQLFKEAKDAGVDSVKLQKRDNRTLFTRKMYDSPYENRNSFGSTYGQHREHLELDYSQYCELKHYAEDLGLHFFATAFDIPSADFLAKVDIPAYKIASGDIKSIPLLKHVASIGKPVIMSTGGATLEDVKRARDAIMPVNEQLAILQCTAAYPPEWDQLNLRVISSFRELFPGNVIGFSSHDNGIAMATAAYVLGARIVEKHFTLSRVLKGTDHAFSLEPVGLRKLVRDLRRVHVALGDGRKVCYEEEKSAVAKMGKSLVAMRDLKAGQVIAEGDLTLKSPGGHVPPYELESLIGKTLLNDIAEDEFLEYADVG